MIVEKKEMVRQPKEKKGLITRIEGRSDEGSRSGTAWIEGEGGVTQRGETNTLTL